MDNENDSNSICEEPRIYYSTSLNFGVGAIFSERNAKSYIKNNISFIPVSAHNNNFSLYNTIV